MLAYIYSWFYTDTPTLPRNPFVSESDLLKVRLRSNTVRIPERIPERIPDVQRLTKEQLDEMLAVTLKKTNVNPKQLYYEPRHPVLRELMKLK